MKMTIRDNKIDVSCDYTDTFVTAAKNMGGKWNRDRGVWEFDGRDAEIIKATLIKIFGYDGTTSEYAKTRVEIDLSTAFDEVDQFDSAMEMSGINFVQRRNSHEMVKLHSSVVLVSGGFPIASGSAKYPSVSPREGTVIQVKDYPLTHARMFQERYSWFKIIDRDSEMVANLKTEREKLMERIADIDRALEEISTQAQA